MSPKFPTVEEMLAKLREPGRTPIVPAPNRWFADPEKHPFQQKMIEKALAHTGQGREGFPSGSYLNPVTGEPMDFDIMEDLGVVIDPATGRPMMSGKKSDLTSIDPKLGSITKSNLVRKGLFKHTGGDQMLKDLAFLATIEKSGKGHHYGLSTQYASPAELVNTMTGSNPTLRPHSRGDIYGVGDVVGQVQIGQGQHHPVYEKLLVAPTGSDVQGVKLHKATGGSMAQSTRPTPEQLAQIHALREELLAQAKLHQQYFDAHKDMPLHMTPTFDEWKAKQKLASGGQPKSKDAMLAHITLNKGQRVPSDIRNVGVNEAPDMPIKSFIMPGASSKTPFPIGGVDYAPKQNGLQILPPPPQLPGQQQQQPGQQQAMPPQGPPNAQPPSNILQMTQQGQALSAMNPGGAPQQPKPKMPPQMPGMKRGGQVLELPGYHHESLAISPSGNQMRYELMNAKHFIKKVK